MNKDIFEIHRRPDFLVLPELISVGMCESSMSHLGGPRIDGTSGLEIGYIQDGSVEWWNGQELDEAGPGSILIDHPGDLQGGQGAIVHPCIRYWLRFNFPETPALPGLSTNTSMKMKQSYENMERRHFPGSLALRELFRALLTQQRAPDAFSEDFSRALFHQILISVQRDFVRNKQSQISESIRDAMTYFACNLHKEVPMSQVAEMVGLSTGYFHDVFLRETGFTPARFHLRQRVTAAKQALIVTDHSITDIAFEIGFSSSQYFATTFKKVVGLTPVRYRKLRSSASPS